MDNKKNITDEIKDISTVSSNNGMNMPMIINEIDNYYKQGAIIYTESLSRYTIEIEKLLSNIDKEVNNKQKEEEILLKIEQELEIDNRFMEQIQDEFMQKIYSIDELNNEYKGLIDEEGYKRILTQKRREVSKIKDKIDNLEITYLSHELERINYLATLEPKRKNIDTLKENLKELKLEKEHFGSTKLHQLPQMGLAYNEVTNGNDDDIINISILEKNLKDVEYLK